MLNNPHLSHNTQIDFQSILNELGSIKFQIKFLSACIYEKKNEKLIYLPEKFSQLMSAVNLNSQYL